MHRHRRLVAAGGRVLNLVDLSDVYMTFFLPTSAAGKVALDIPSPYAGRVVAIHVTAGDMVEEGAPLITLETV